jgi:hypothetical protein
MAEKDPPVATTAIDRDEDGLTDDEERRIGTNPDKWDSDGDGITDGTEVNSLRSNPKLRDTDGDGLGDNIEMWTHTGIANPDTDGDGMSDGFEAAIGEHPRVKDLNADPTARAQTSEDLIRSMEQQLGITEHNVDTDGDGFADWVEVMGSNGDPKVHDMTENMVVNPSPLDRFLEVARQQEGVPYKFGAEVDMRDLDPKALDSSELVQWAAHQAGVEIPDGSWMQYRHLHEQGASISVDHALKTPGALVFGFSSDPLASTDRPARAYVGISLGDGRVIDVSERAGEVRVLGHGDYFTHAALVPEFIDHIPQRSGYPAVDQMLHPTSRLQKDTDGDGMLDVDERVLERDPFDPSDADPNESPAPDQSPAPATDEDGPVTSPRQVDPTLAEDTIDAEPANPDPFAGDALATNWSADDDLASSPSDDEVVAHESFADDPAVDG